jgi:hypothetical protein
VKERCPLCREEPTWRCRCILGHRRCARGHEWHYCTSCGVAVVAPANHSAPASDLHCAECRTDLRALTLEF